MTTGLCCNKAVPHAALPLVTTLKRPRNAGERFTGRKDPQVPLIVQELKVSLFCLRDLHRGFHDAGEEGVAIHLPDVVPQRSRDLLPALRARGSGPAYLVARLATRFFARYTQTFYEFTAPMPDLRRITLGATPRSRQSGKGTLAGELPVCILQQCAHAGRHAITIGSGWSGC